MARIAWITDPHLNFAIDRYRTFLYDSVHFAEPDAVLISGDIAESRELEGELVELAATFGKPLYFVLGNHDYYRSSVAEVRERVRTLVTETPGLVYLSQAGVVELAPDVGLIGHDGWGDGRLGDFFGSDVQLNDYVLIAELAETRVALGNDKVQLAKKLARLGDEAAAHLQRLLPEVLERFAHVVVLTHVPPFREACWYEGRQSDDNWAPHFSCRAVGDVLRAAMQAHPTRQMLVLCGHTHGAGRVKMLENLEVMTGGAQYSRPVVSEVFEFPQWFLRGKETGAETEPAPV